MTSAIPGQVVMVAFIGPVATETVLRDAFEEAERRGTALHVVASGPASDMDDAALTDLVGRWADKYPGIPVTVSVRRAVDAAVTLVAATRSSSVAYLPAASDPRSAAVLQDLIRRAHCPVVVARQCA